MYYSVSIIKSSAFLICILILLSCNTGEQKDVEEVKPIKENTKSINTNEKEIAINEKETLLDSINEIKDPKAKKIALGKLIYNNDCAFCHQKNGDGKGTYTPPLKKIRFLC